MDADEETRPTQTHMSYGWMCSRMCTYDSVHYLFSMLRCYDSELFPDQPTKGIRIVGINFWEPYQSTYDLAERRVWS